MKVNSFLRNPFSFLFATSKKEERIVQYIIREHDRGRSLNDILEDPFIRNRCTKDEIGRLLERPELIKALGEDIVESARAGRPAS
jgi:hypothetical protein